MLVLQQVVESGESQGWSKPKGLAPAGAGLEAGLGRTGFVLFMNASVIDMLVPAMSPPSGESGRYPRGGGSGV